MGRKVKGHVLLISEIASLNLCHKDLLITLLIFTLPRKMQLSFLIMCDLFSFINIVVFLHTYNGREDIIRTYTLTFKSVK